MRGVTRHITGNRVRSLRCAVIGLSIWVATAGLAAITTPASASLQPPPGDPAASGVTLGYWEVASDGGIFSFGNVPFYGSLGGQALAAPVVGMAATSDGGGYWEVESNGQVSNFGDASPSVVTRVVGTVGMIGVSTGSDSFLQAGSDGSVVYQGRPVSVLTSGNSFPHNAPIVGIAATPYGSGGYWLASSDGGVFSFGNAQFYGSAGALHLNSPIVGMAATFDGGGYWLVASDGGIFSYGDAAFYGSRGGQPLNKPIVGMVSSAAGHGYLLVASDGGIFNYGEAPFYGSTGSMHLNAPIVGIAASSLVTE